MLRAWRPSSPVGNFSSSFKQEFVRSGTLLATARIRMQLLKESFKTDEVVVMGRAGQGERRVRMTGAFCGQQVERWQT